MTATIELDERIGKCHKILEVDPNSQIFAALAEAYRKKGELDKAFRICQNGLKIHPSYGSAHIVMSKINLDRGLYDWAEIEAKKAMELDGRTRSIELLLAEIYIYKGEFNNAVKLLKKLNLADPHNMQIIRLLEIAQRIPEEQQAVIQLKEERQHVPPPPKAQEALVQPQEKLSPKEIVNRAIRIPSIDGALLINFEGLVMESEWTLKIDAGTCGATIGEVGLQLDQELVKSSFGSFYNVLIEAGKYTYYLARAHDGLFLFVANEAANLGTIRMKIENLLASYR